MKAFALSGLAGVGKTTATEVAAEEGYPTVSVGDVVREEYDRCAPEASVGEFVVEMHAAEGVDCFARRAVAAVRERRTVADGVAPGVVVEGVHSVPSVRALREAFGSVTVVWIRAAFERRLDRLRDRDGGQDAAALLRRDLRELNCGLSALARPLGHDVLVENDGSLDAYRSRLREVFDR
ncbi:MAG: AAA family ATPase [Halolamina sp.]